MNVVAYVIHLQRSASRMEAVRDLQDRCPVPTIVQDAVDGALLDDSLISHCYSRSLFAPRYPFTLRPAEIGIFLSHRSCWRRMIDEGADAALILEDDVGLSSEFDQAFSLACEHVHELGIIQFQVRKFRGEARPVVVSAGVSGPRIHEHVVVPLGAVAQLVSRKAADRLMEVTEVFDRPVDTFLQLRNITGQRMYSMYSSGVAHTSKAMGGTTIHTGGKRAGFLEREVKRFIYRSRVRRLSRRYWNSEILGSNCETGRI